MAAALSAEAARALWLEHLAHERRASPRTLEAYGFAAALCLFGQGRDGIETEKAEHGERECASRIVLRVCKLRLRRESLRRLALRGAECLSGSLLIRDRATALALSAAEP